MKNSHDPNVTLRIDEEQKYFPCPVCGELRVLEQTIKGKPYLTCNDCGVQLFVRGKEGIRKISEQLADYTAVGISKGKMSLLDQYNELQKKLVDIRDKKPLFGNNEILNIQEEVINVQIGILKNALEINIKDERRT